MIMQVPCIFFRIDGTQDSGHTLARSNAFHESRRAHPVRDIYPDIHEQRTDILDVSAKSVRRELRDQSVDGRQCTPLIARTGRNTMGAAARGVDGSCAGPSG